MAVDVLLAQRRKGFVVHNDDVGGGAGLEHTELAIEVLARHLGVVLEQHGHGLAPAHVGHGGVVALNDQEDLEALEHVVGVGVGAHAHGDATTEELEHGSAAHGVAHIGFGVVDEPGAGLLDDIHLGRRHVDAVAQHGVGTQQVVLQQALDGADAAAVEAGIPHVVHALAHMDVEAGQAVVGLGHLIHGLVRKRKGGMSAKHGGDHMVVVIATLLGGPLGKFGVLGNGLVAFFLAAAIGDLVAQARTHAQLLSCVLNCKEATRDLAETRMVIEDRGDAIADGVQNRGIGAGLGAVERQVVVDLPPLLLKILQEVGGVAALNGKAAGQTRVDVGVAVDESGHDEVALGVDVLGIRVLGLELALGAHFDDRISVNGDRTVWNERGLSVASKDGTVSDQKHGCSLQHQGRGLTPLTWRSAKRRPTPETGPLPSTLHQRDKPFEVRLGAA